MDGPYSQGYDYDAWGNVTHKYGWGGEVQGGGAGQSSDIYYSYSGNRRSTTGFVYDAAGNLTNDTTQTYQYDATGQQTAATWSSGYTPSFTDDPLNPGGTHTVIKLVHLTELRAEVNKLRVRAGLAQVTNWSPDSNPVQNVTPVHHNHITQLRAKLEEAFNALHLSIGTYAHAGPNAGDTIYAIDFQELRTKIKDAWTALASAPVITQSYDGDGLRVKKNEYGAVTYYVRSTVLGGQVISELDNNGGWSRGYVYSGSSLLAVQQGGVFWIHEDAVTKSKRVTDVSGNVVSGVEVDPFGADTNRSFAQPFQPHKYTTYERDGNGSDEAMFRRYNRQHSRFDQPDPADNSYNSTDPQSLNRYGYTQNDPANFVDPTGLMMMICLSQWGGGERPGWSEACVFIFTPPDYFGIHDRNPGGGTGESKNLPAVPQPQKKPKCKQDKNGGDRADIESKLAAAGVSGNISNIRSAAGVGSPEGILFDVDNRTSFIDTIRSTGSFTEDIPSEPPESSGWQGQEHRRF